MSNEITLEDIGPIRDLRLQVSESGGVYVLLGRNGSGKSTAIAAVQSLASGSGRIEASDGAARGEVNAFGVTLRVSRRLSRSGELEVCEHGELVVLRIPRGIVRAIK